MTLSSHDSDKSRANQFASFLSDESWKIRDTFVPTHMENHVHPPDSSRISEFTQVSEGVVIKKIRYPVTKSCLLDPCQTCQRNHLDLFWHAIT